MRVKYIVVDNGLHDVMIMFSDLLQHADFKGSFYNIVSAGFINPETLSCSGKSISLGLGSRPEDTELARRQFREMD